jgi:hypothetical protein
MSASLGADCDDGEADPGGRDSEEDRKDSQLVLIQHVLQAEALGLQPSAQMRGAKIA